MRYGIIGICISPGHTPDSVNKILGENHQIILGRMGMPIKGSDARLISLLVEGDTDAIGRLAGRVGELDGVEIKSMLMKSDVGLVSCE